MLTTSTCAAEPDAPGEVRDAARGLRYREFLTVLLVIESYIGGLIRDDSKDTLTAVHIPLAMAIMALVIWLAMRARTKRAAS